MCYNCGCHIPEDNMGSADNITDNTFEHLAEHWGKPILEAKKAVYQYLLGENPKLSDHDKEHIEEMFTKAAKAWGQPIEEAKKNATELLKKQVSN
jgi:hypothetical protein